MKRVLDYICSPSFMMVLVWFSLSASSLVAYHFFEWPYLMGCAMYFFILMVAYIAQAWSKKN